MVRFEMNYAPGQVVVPPSFGSRDELVWEVSFTLHRSVVDTDSYSSGPVPPGNPSRATTTGRLVWRMEKTRSRSLPLVLWMNRPNDISIYSTYTFETLRNSFTFHTISMIIVLLSLWDWILPPTGHGLLFHTPRVLSITLTSFSDVKVPVIDTVILELRRNFSLYTSSTSRLQSPCSVFRE